MAFNLTRFIIRGLHSKRSFDIPIVDNRVVMVGVNGLGKTTIVNILFLVLSRQWSRLLDYNFESIELHIDGVVYLLQKVVGGGSAVERRKRLRTLIRKAVALEMLDYENSSWIERIVGFSPGYLNVDELTFELDRRLPVPLGVCRRIALAYLSNVNQLEESGLSQLEAFLASKANAYEVLYLPTYRRVEKELRFIFPELEATKQSLRRGTNTDAVQGGFVELVEFGMEDVEATLQKARSELIETTRMELSNLAGEYLRDVVRGKGRDYEIGTFNSLDNKTVERILGRAEERTLSTNDKSKLRDVIRRLSTAPSHQTSEEDKYIAHFFAKLIRLDRVLSEKELLILKFARVCNQYLVGKHIVYDDKDSSIAVRLEDSNEQLELRHLSSGEKQIVSLFAHLYFRGRDKIFVIIDEPELSLSAKWQTRFLPNVLDSGRCAFLAAVTHSPFIFSNSLDSYAVDLESCVLGFRR